MFAINEDMSIYVTRGDIATLRVAADNNGTSYIFQPGDVVRFKVTEKKACENVMFYKDFSVAAETESVDIVLTEADTKIGDVISKPTEYWYEIELNPFTNPQTIVGYDEDGAKVFKLFPEGNDVESAPIEPEEIPVVDAELDSTSTRPVQNQVVTREFLSIRNILSYLVEKVKELLGGFAELKKSVSDGKEEIAAAITYQEVNTAIDLSHHEMSVNIRKIKRGQGDAIPSQVLEGITFTNKDGKLYEGTMPDMSMDWDGKSVEVSNDQFFSVFNYGYRSPEYDCDSLAFVTHPIAEVNEVTGYTEYKNAVVDGLANSGLGVTQETEADELQSILEARFPNSTYDLESTWTLDTINEGNPSTAVRNNENVTFTANFADGHTAYCETADIPIGNYTHMKVVGTATCSGASLQTGGTMTIIAGSNTFTKEIPYGETISFEFSTNASATMRIETTSEYQTVTVTFSIYLYNESDDDTGSDVSAIVEKLNYYTGTTGTMTIEEIANKINGILGEISSQKTRARNFYYYCKTITEIRNPLDFSQAEDFYGFCFGCSELTYVATLNTESGKDFTNLFNGDGKLVTVERINVSNTSQVTRLGNAFSKCYELQNLTFEGTIPANLDVSDCTKLTLASLTNILENLKNVKDTGTTLYLVISAESETILTNAGIDISAIGEEKGWTIGTPDE